MIFKYLRSRWVIGLAVLKLIVLHLFRADGGLPGWLRRLRKERLAPPPQQLWSVSAVNADCIGCGLCDAFATGRERPSHWILGEDRLPGDSPDVLEHASRLRVLAEDIAKICPARVPAEKIAELIESNAARLSE